jgi:superkiller protein 3
MKTTRLLKAEIIILALVAVLWAVDLKTDCVPRTAAGALRQVVKVAPNSERAYDLLGDTYYSFGQCDKGDKAYEHAEIAACRKAVEAYPHDPNAHFNLAIAYSYADESERAIESFEEAIRLDPNDASTYKAMGYFYIYDVNEPEAALECYQKAVQLDPSDAWAWIDLGDAYTDNHLPSKAIEAYREAIRLDPNEPHAKGSLAYGYLNLGTSYEEEGREEDAQACFQKAMQTDSHLASELFCWGNLLSKEQDWERAIERYQCSLALDPDNPKAHYNLGRAYLELDNKDLASEQYRTLKELDEELAERLHALVSTL